MFPIEPQRLRPIQEFLRRLLPAVNLIDPVNNLLAVRQRKAVATGGILLGRFDAVAFDRFRQQTDRPGRVGLGCGDPLLNCEINRLQIVSVRHRDHVPSQRAHRRERPLHGEGVFRYASRKLGVIVRNHQHIRVHTRFGSQAGNGRERFFGLAFHRRAVAHGTNRNAIAFGNLVRDGQPLRLRQRGTERAVAEQHALRIQMRLAMASELAFDAAKRFQIFKCHSVESVVGAQRVNAVFGVAGVVDETKRFMPLAAWHGKHDPVDRGHDFCERGRPAPVTGRAAIDRVHVHQSHQRARGARIPQNHFLPRRVFDSNGILRRAARRGREPGFEIQRSQRRRFNLFNDGLVFSHKIPVQIFS